MSSKRPVFSSMTKNDLLANTEKYYKEWHMQIKKNVLYKDIITQLTNKPVSDFIEPDSDGVSFTIHENNIIKFKIEGDSRSVLNKLKNTV